MTAGLSNVFLEKFLSARCSNFIGVYSVDTVPPDLWRRKQRCCSIINLSKANHPGSHFIAIYIDGGNNLWYFDSYALPPPVLNYHLMVFLKQWIERKKMRYVLSRPIQDFDSLFCGWHTAAFCLFVNAHPKYHPRHFHSLFDTLNLRKNEKIVSYLIKNLCNRLYFAKAL